MGLLQRLKTAFGGADHDIDGMMDESWSGRRNRPANQRHGAGARRETTQDSSHDIDPALQRAQHAANALASPEQGVDGRLGTAQAASKNTQRAGDSSLPPLHPTASSGGSSGALPAAVHPPPRAEVRASSLPQPLAQGPPRSTASSGPGAPISPDPEVPPQALRRVSSQHSVLSGTLSGRQDASGAAAMLPALPDTYGEAADAQGQQHSARAGKSAKSQAEPAALRGPELAAGAAAGPYGLLAAADTSPSPAAEVAAVSPAPERAPLSEPAQHGVPIPPAASPGGRSPPLPECGTPASAAVSLLSLQLRGASGNTSAATSRETSFRGSRRQPPMGGLSLALSRESSVRGGSVRGARDGSMRAGTREGSMRAGTRDGSMRGTGSYRYRAGGGYEAVQIGPNGQRTYRGLVVVGRDQDEEDQADAAAPGCGSSDWMGMPAASKALFSPGQAAQELADPFMPGGPAIEEEEEEQEALPPVLPPEQVGSWAKRVTKFPAASAAPAQPGGGLDPLLLTAALEALAAEPTPGSSAGTPPGNVLVGDSELAMTGSAEQPAGGQQVGGQPFEPGSWTAARAAGGFGAELALPAVAAAALSSSWDAAHEARARVMPAVQLGGSAPTRSLDVGVGAPTSPSKLALTASQPLVGELTADAREWNRSFMKRWRAVKKRAYLQALGLRALWRVNSLSDRHEPLELLTNDLPAYDNGMRRAWSASRLHAPDEERHASGGHGRPASAAVQTGGVRASDGALHKDPSLAALLLGEVAEVC